VAAVRSNHLVSFRKFGIIFIEIKIISNSFTSKAIFFVCMEMGREALYTRRAVGSKTTHVGFAI